MDPHKSIQVNFFNKESTKFFKKKKKSEIYLKKLKPYEHKLVPWLLKIIK